MRITRLALSVATATMMYCAADKLAAGPFGIEFDLGPPEGADEIVIAPGEPFSLFFRHTHAAYGGGTFYFDATLSYDDALLDSVAADWVQPLRPATADPYTLTEGNGSLLLEVTWFIDDFADGDDLFRLDFQAQPDAVAATTPVAFDVPTIALTVSSSIPKIYDYTGPELPVEVTIVPEPTGLVPTWLAVCYVLLRRSRWRVAK